MYFEEAIEAFNKDWEYHLSGYLTYDFVKGKGVTRRYYPPIPPGGGDSFLKKIFRKYYPPSPPYRLTKKYI